MLDEDSELDWAIEGLQISEQNNVNGRFKDITDEKVSHGTKWLVKYVITNACDHFALLPNFV